MVVVVVVVVGAVRGRREVEELEVEPSASVEGSALPSSW